jgi:hypothetical protein
MENLTWGAHAETISLLTCTVGGGEWSASGPWRKSPQYPLNKRLREPQRQSERLEEVKIFYSTRTQTPSPVAVPTALSQLMYI